MGVHGWSRSLSVGIELVEASASLFILLDGIVSREPFILDIPGRLRSHIIIHHHQPAISSLSAKSDLAQI